MVEYEPSSDLATWRSAVWPVIRRTRVTRLPDHRRAYLDHEGPVGGDRGSVVRVASGMCSIPIRSAQAWVVELDLPAAGVRLYLKQLDASQWEMTTETPEK